MNTTTQQLIAAGQQMATHLHSRAGYDRVTFDSARVLPEGNLEFELYCVDGFQEKLSYEARFKYGSQRVSCESIDEAWKKLADWPSRKIRELNVSIKLTEHLREHVGELRSELLREQYLSLFEGLDKAKEAMLPAPGQSLAD